MDLRDLLLVLAGAAFELILLEVPKNTVSSLVHSKSSTSVIGDRGLLPVPTFPNAVKEA